MDLDTDREAHARNIRLAELAEQWDDVQQGAGEHLIRQTEESRVETVLHTASQTQGENWALPLSLIAEFAALTPDAAAGALARIGAVDQGDGHWALHESHVVED